MTTVQDAYSTARDAARAERRAPRVGMLVRVAGWAGRRVGRMRFANVRRAVMQTAAFAVLDVAAWRWDVTAGLVAIGLSLFVLEALTGESPARR